MSQPSQKPLHPSELRFIKRLVVVLTSVMIVGLILILGLLVTRLARAPMPFALPDGVRLPDGARAQAVTLSHRYVLVLTDDASVLLFDREDGAFLGRMVLQQHGGAN
jgi:hypothetical protein